MDEKIFCADSLDALKELDDCSINCIVTSPPYNKKGLNGGPKAPGNQIWSKYNIDYNQYADNMDECSYENWMVDVINEMCRVLKDDGSLFFNHKPRRHNNRVHLPTKFIERTDAFIYQVIIWDRKNSPNIRKDHLLPTTEYVYWLCKGKPKSFRHQLENKYISEVWQIPAQRQDIHPAPFPEQIVENCILLSTEKGDLVLDPFCGSGTTLVVANNLERDYMGFDIDSKYIEYSISRIGK